MSSGSDVDGDVIRKLLDSIFNIDETKIAKPEFLLNTRLLFRMIAGVAQSVYR
jgi:hypothetical protein